MTYNIKIIDLTLDQSSEINDLAEPYVQIEGLVSGNMYSFEVRS